MTHEDEFTNVLRLEGHEVLETKRATPDQMASETKRAMLEVRETITQGYLVHESFAGFTDFLVKVDGQSILGDYHYEVWDTKLSKKL